MYELKTILRMTTIAIGIVMYIYIWFSMIKNWDKCVRTGYAYPCFEKFLGEFYFYWITMHIILTVCTFIWAWIA